MTDEDVKENEEKDECKDVEMVEEKKDTPAVVETPILPNPFSENVFWDKLIAAI